MTLKTPAAQALTDLTAFHSTDNPWVQAVTYDGTPIDAEYEFGKTWDQETRSVLSVVWIWVKKSDVVLPDYRDPVVVEGTTYYVREIDIGDSVRWSLMLYTERPTL